MTLRTGLLTAALTAAVSAALAGAAAPSTASPGICREADAADHELAVCFHVGPVGTVTVNPSYSLYCYDWPVIGTKSLCDGQTREVGTTGFVPDPGYPQPEVDAATGSVLVHAGTVGHLWVAGTPTPVTVTRFCVGDPNFC